VTGVDYGFTVQSACDSPTDVRADIAGSLTIQWDDQCMISGSRDFWVKVEAHPSSVPTYSCSPYELRIRHFNRSSHCCTLTSCSAASTCVAAGCANACTAGFCVAP